jgi:hypothetical protein
MKKKLICILICIILIATTIPTIRGAGWTEKQKLFTLDGAANELSTEPPAGGA